MVLLRATYIWNRQILKQDKKSCFCLQNLPRTSSGKLKEKSACNVLEKNFTAVISQDFSAFRTFQRKCLYKEVHFCESYWALPPNFRKKNPTVVISKVFFKSFETKQITNCLYLQNFSRKMSTMKFISGKITDFYWKPLQKSTPL